MVRRHAASIAESPRMTQRQMESSQQTNATCDVVPGIADENECHKFALKLNAPKHGCIEYLMAAPHFDVADTLQDAQQDGIIR